MPATQTDLIRTVPSIVPSDIPALSDDECLAGLRKPLPIRIPSIWTRWHG
jgi:hypothetical protein